jgi:hypothetical protein
MVSKHDSLLERIVNRLVDKNDREVFVEQPLNDGKRMYGRADILTRKETDGHVFLRYYEIKTGSCRKKAKIQARNFFNAYKGAPGVSVRFIYISSHTGVERWLPPYNSSRRNND